MAAVCISNSACTMSDRLLKMLLMPDTMVSKLSRIAFPPSESIQSTTACVACCIPFSSSPPYLRIIAALAF